MQCLRLCLPDSHSREISGLDTRSVAASCALVTEGLATDTRVDVFAECHSTLRIGPGKAIEVGRFSHYKRKCSTKGWAPQPDQPRRA